MHNSILQSFGGYMYFRTLTISLMVLGAQIFGQTAGSEIRKISIGSLQSHFTDFGSERAWNGQYYGGLRWPAEYPGQDNAVIKRAWIGCQDFTDETSTNHDNYTVYFYSGDVGRTLYPTELSQTAKFGNPSVIVNGLEYNYLAGDVIDTVDPTQIADRRIMNVVNTSMGLTQTREILAFSNQNHDNYFIKIFTYTNTGNTNGDPEIELNDSLHGVRIGWGSRYSCGREGAYLHDWSYAYGKHSWVTRRGEDYPDHYLDPITPENPIANWLRSGFSWMGQSQSLSWDNIGAPDVLGDGRLVSPQFVGSVVLHVDVSANDSSDDISQPVFLGWQAGDTYPHPDNYDATYNFLAGNPYPDTSMGGINRMDDALQSITDRIDPYTIHGDGGGTNVMMAYGPFDLAPGESITIVEAEGVNGLSREVCQQIGQRWKVAYDNPDDLGPFTLPDGSTTADKDLYKNSWVYTGMDSIMLTFTRAKQAFDANFETIRAPSPPMVFDVFATREGINLSWDNSAEQYPEFGGYKLYRNQESYYGTFEEVFSCGNDDLANSWVDTDVIDSVDYFYYVVSWATNNIGETLESSRFYTMTTNPVNISGSLLVDADLYVHPDGNDENSGLSASEPLKTIGKALGIILHTELHPHTIHLASGTYSPSSNGEIYPLYATGHLSISGEIGTVLDAENLAPVLRLRGDNMHLNNLLIMNGSNHPTNPPFYVGGGGLAMFNGDLSLSNVDIMGCSLHTGGGLWASKSRLTFANVNITGNSATTYGGGMLLENCEPLVFDDENPTSIYNNLAGFAGFDLYTPDTLGVSNYGVTVDTFSVVVPSDYHAYPSSSFSFVIGEGVITQHALDFYVSPLGNDQNSGLDSTEAFKTIAKAIQLIETSLELPRTIFLAEGIYAPGTTGEKFPLLPRDNLTIKGISSAQSILDAEQSSGLVEILNHAGVFLEDMGLINAVVTSSGATIHANESYFNLTNMVIEGNRSGNSNGNLRLDNQSHGEMTNVTIRNNYGGGIVLQNNSTLAFSASNRCNIYNNSSYDIIGVDIRSSDQLTPLSIILDTFTVQFPTEYYAYPLQAYTFDIQNSIIFQVEADLYVSSQGSDGNSGTTPEAPLKTLSYANSIIFADAERPHTIHVSGGLYGMTSNGEALPIYLRNHVSISGDPENIPIFDGEGLNGVFVCENVQGAVLSNLLIQGGSGENGAGILSSDDSELTLLNLNLQSNVATANGGALFASNSQITIEECQFSNNTAYLGAGLYGLNSDFYLSRTLFSGDSARNGGAIYMISSHADMNQLTIANNYAIAQGGAIYSREESQTSLQNSILWENGTRIFYVRYNSGLRIWNSNIQNADPSTVVDSIFWFGENIEGDPLFCNTEGRDYHLANNSPCLGAGTNGVDLGALDVGCTVAVDEIAILPSRLTLYQNYPNPFNPITMIKYGLPEASEVVLTIFDVRGRVVKRFKEEHQSAGWYELTWNGQNNENQRAGSGIYFCRMQAGTQSETIKMILLK